MKPNEIKEIFQETFKGKNMMTPDIIKFGESGGFIFELSEGTGFNREPIFGVTVLELTEGEAPKRRSDLSQMFHNLTEAKDFAENL